MKRVLRWLWRGGLFVFGLWVIFSFGLIFTIIFYGNQDFARPADVIIVLGAGVEADGTPSKTLEMRALHSAALWEQGIAPKIICTGAVIGSAPRSESSACREVLEHAGVPSEAVLWEERSINTEQNAQYTLEMMAQHDMQTAVVISSRYHLLRARWLYWRQGQHVHTSPTPIGYLTNGEIIFSYTREWAAFHWQVIRDRLNTPHVYVPVP